MTYGEKQTRAQMLPHLLGDIYMKAFDLTLYLVTDSMGLAEKDFLRIVEEACDGGVTLLQLREKEKSGLEYYLLAEKVKQIADRYGIPLIIDDRADVAMAVDAAGIHVGQQDLPVQAVRRLLGEGKIIGASAKTVAQARQAHREGADYLGVGAIYPTTTKVITVITEVDVLNEIGKQTGLPIVAIGGLSADNMHVLYDSMADGIAVVTAIMKSEDPREAAQTLKKQIREHFTNRNTPEGK
jgi:thiamine-phosphate pyrophosphorylase